METACPRKIWFGLYSSGQTPFLRLSFFLNLFVWYHIMTEWCSSLNDLKFGQDVFTNFVFPKFFPGKIRFFRKNFFSNFSILGRFKGWCPVLLGDVTVLQLLVQGYRSQKIVRVKNRIIYVNPSVEVPSKYLYPLVPTFFAFASECWIKEILYEFLNSTIPWIQCILVLLILNCSNHNENKSIRLLNKISIFTN